jgi:hypothetical protein
MSVLATPISTCCTAQQEGANGCTESDQWNGGGQLRCGKGCSDLPSSAVQIQTKITAMSIRMAFA